MALAGGPWMLRLWLDYGNPLYPFADHWFVPTGEASRIGRDLRFLPSGVSQALSWPFRWAVSSQPLVAEVPMRDPRRGSGAAGGARGCHDAYAGEAPGLLLRAARCGQAPD